MDKMKNLLLLFICILSICSGCVSDQKYRVKHLNGIFTIESLPKGLEIGDTTQVRRKILNTESEGIHYENSIVIIQNIVK